MNKDLEQELERFERKAFLRGDLDLVLIIDSFQFEDDHGLLSEID